MYNFTRYVVWLTDKDRITIDMGFGATHVMIDASVNYVAKLQGRWVEIGRYDNAHGAPHVHRFGKPSKVPRPLSFLSVLEMVERGKRDFLGNWPKYRALMEAPQP